MTDPAPKPVVAAFDFDLTLTTRDSVVPFLESIVGRRALVAGVARRPVRSASALVRRDRHRLRSVATDVVFAGRPHDDVRAAGRRMADLILEHHLRADTVARLRWHVAEGHLVVIVSASYHDYLEPIADHLGVHGVVSTALDVVDGRCTGSLHGANCRGPEKVVRLDAWLRSQGLTREAVTLWAYGDSSGDRELLAWADHPVWVREPLTSVSP